MRILVLARSYVHLSQIAQMYQWERRRDRDAVRASEEGRGWRQSRGDGDRLLHNRSMALLFPRKQPWPVEHHSNKRLRVLPQPSISGAQIRLVDGPLRSHREEKQKAFAAEEAKGRCLEHSVRWPSAQTASNPFLKKRLEKPPLCLNVQGYVGGGGPGCNEAQVPLSEDWKAH